MLRMLAKIAKSYRTRTKSGPQTTNSWLSRVSHGLVGEKTGYPALPPDELEEGLDEEDEPPEEDAPPDEEEDFPELLVDDDDDAILTRLIFTAVSIMVVICGELKDFVTSVSIVF